MLKNENEIAKSGNGSAASVRITESAALQLARTIFLQLQESGCQTKDVIAVSSQLIALVTSALANEVEAAH